MKKDKFERERKFIEKLKNIDHRKGPEDRDLCEYIMKAIDDAKANKEDKEKLKKIIKAIRPDICEINNTYFVSALNTTFNKLIFLAKSYNPGLPTGVIVPMLNLSESLDAWLENITEAVIPFILNSGLLDIYNIKE